MSKDKTTSPPEPGEATAELGRLPEFYERAEGLGVLTYDAKLERRGRDPRAYLVLIWSDGSEAIFPTEWLRREAERYPAGRVTWR